VLLPLLFFTGLMNTLDRTNLSFAALQMNAQLHISAQVCCRIRVVPAHQQ
jgi:hypothetical protein